jgi:hypothetical protein
LSIWIPKIKRALTLAAVWSLASYCAYLAFGAWQEHKLRETELRAAREDYDARLQEYSKLLAEGDALRGDKQYQKDLLKKRFGYTEPDETPIVIVRDNNASDDQPATATETH